MNNINRAKIGQRVKWVDGMGVERKGTITEVRTTDNDVVVKDDRTECQIRLNITKITGSRGGVKQQMG